MANILICGGAGFVGSHLGHYLQSKGHIVHLLDNLSTGHLENLRGHDFFIKADIRDNDISRWIEGMDVVINLAAIATLPVCQIDPFDCYSNNVAGHAHLLEMCRRMRTPKIIFSSTSAVYENTEPGQHSGISYFREDDKINPYLTYSMSKKHAEEITQSYRDLYGMDITTVRMFNVYGAGMDMNRKSPPLIAYVVKCLQNNVRPLLHSDGEQQRDYIHIDDVCTAFEKVINHKNGTFNICSGRTVTVNQIYSEITKLMQSDIKPIFRNASLLWDKYEELTQGFPIHPQIIADETNKWCKGSYKELCWKLDWRPEINIEEGIKRTVQGYLKCL